MQPLFSFRSVSLPTSPFFPFLFPLLFLFPLSLQAQPVLTLEDAVRATLEHNFEVRMARNDARIAANDYSLGNAGFLPSISMRAQQSRRTYGRDTGDSANPVFNSVNTVDVGMNLSTTLFDGFRQFTAYQRLESQMELAELGADWTTENTVAGVVTAYYDLVRQQEQIEVMQEAVDISEERVEIAELRRDLGSGSELDVRRARVDLNADRAALLRQRVSLTNAKAEFNRLLGRDIGLDYVVADSIRIEEPLALDALRTSSLQNNKTLAVVRQGEETAQLARREVQSEWFPSIGLTAGYAFNELTQELGMLASQPPGLSYGLTANIPLFDGFNRRRRRANADLRLRNAELAVAETNIALETRLENAHQNLRFSLELVDLERENVSLAKLNLEVALERFRLGTITSVDLREVQSALTNAEGRFITAQFEAARAQTQLLQISGTLLQRLAE